MRYLIRMEPGVQSSEETLTLESGSCRDSAWLLVEILRHLGLAARFVSGYLIQLKPDVKPLDGPAGPAQDFTDLHAWTEVYLPGAGWVGPRSDLRTVRGRGPHSARGHAGSLLGRADLRRVWIECEVKFTHEMTVTRIHEDPRVTLPYTDEQWQRIEALGGRIDQDICSRRRPPHHGRRADLRLDRRHGRRGVEHRRAGPGKAQAGGATCWTACASASRRAGCCITARANGIRANRCRAGR